LSYFWLFKFLQTNVWCCNATILPFPVWATAKIGFAFPHEITTWAGGLTRKVPTAAGVFPLTLLTMLAMPLSELLPPASLK
jgi:hypothetical protein